MCRQCPYGFIIRCGVLNGILITCIVIYMKLVFTQRHAEAIQKGTLKVSFDSMCRVSIKRVLERYSEWVNEIDDYAEFLDVREELKTRYGHAHLRAYKVGKLEPTDSLSDVIENGWPGNVLDIVETWLEQNPSKSRKCEDELNERLLGHGSPWRFIAGNAVLVNSEFLNSEIRAKCVQLLDRYDILGASEEYSDSINDLTCGETKDAVVKAHKSVESVMKAVLDKEGDVTFGVLLSDLLKSGIIPEYYNEFLIHFEKLALGAVKERNLPARGHGQGRESTEVSHALAEFTVHLAGALNLFIVQRWAEQKQTEDTIQF